jgi:alcohol dehydrogenase
MQETKDEEEPVLEMLPRGMKAAVLTQYVERAEEIKDAVQFQEDFRVPCIDDKQVLVRVHAAAINPVDYKFCFGRLRLILPKLPWACGFDVAGRVVQVGAKCKRIKIGDRVMGMAYFRQTGSFAEYMAIPETNIALKPENATYAEAASLPLVGLTSYQALFDTARLEKGQKMLILGAAGGTGSIAVQLAASIGASRVVGTCSERNAEFVRGLGAHETIDYHSHNWWEALDGQDFDVIYDCVGGTELWTHSERVLKKGGIFVTIAGDLAAGKSTFPQLVLTGARLANRKFWSLFAGCRKYHFIRTDAARSDQLDIIAQMVALGKIRPTVSSVYPFSPVGVRQIFEEIISGRARGKVALAVSDKANERS